MEEDKSPYGTTDSEGKNSEAISDSNTSLEDHNSTDISSNTGLSDNQQVNEGNRTSDTADPQKAPVEGHDIEKKEAGYEEGDLSGAKSGPKRDAMMESKSKSHDEEEQRKDDNNEPPRQEPIAATTASNLFSWAKGSSEKEDRPAKPRVTWSPNLVRFLGDNEDETEKSDDQVNVSGENGQESCSKGADASEVGESGNVSGGGASKSNVEGEQDGAGEDNKKD